MSKYEVRVEIIEKREPGTLVDPMPVFQMATSADTLQEVRSLIDEHLSILAPDNLVKYTKVNVLREDTNG